MLNSTKVGNFIMDRRKESGMTQQQFMYDYPNNSSLEK